MNNRRYFLVYFTGINKKGEQQRGKIHMFVENDGYVNERHVKDSIKNNFGLKDPYVERVDEMDEADFYDFISEEYPGSTEQEIQFKPEDKDDLDELI